MIKRNIPSNTRRRAVQSTLFKCQQVSLYPSTSILGLLRGYDGCCNENVEIEFCERWSVLPSWSRCTKWCEVSFHLIGMSSSLVGSKGREWKIFCCPLVLKSEPQIRKFRFVVWQTTWKKSTLISVARLFFLASLICGIVVPKQSKTLKLSFTSGEKYLRGSSCPLVGNLDSHEEKDLQRSSRPRVCGTNSHP